VAPTFPIAGMMSRSFSGGCQIGNRKDEDKAGNGVGSGEVICQGELGERLLVLIAAMGDRKMGVDAKAGSAGHKNYTC
jgi:hypothetical protein